MEPDISADKAELHRLLEQQEKSAKMLIRRDLELSRANDRLRELDQLKSEFVTVAAHQLRTPLSGIKWALKAVVSGELGSLNTEQRAYLLKAYEANDRVIGLLRDMLLADQIEVGRLVSTEIPVKLGDLLDTLILEARNDAQAKKIRIDFQPPAGLYGRVSIDPKNMRIAFENLIENAIKYTKAGGSITIAVEPAGSSIVVRIADTGIGIPADAQKKVFSRFFRAQNAVREVTDGSGLGLFIVQKIVEKNRGRIWFESTEGTGTTFFVELPTIKE